MRPDVRSLLTPTLRNIADRTPYTSRSDIDVRYDFDQGIPPFEAFPRKLVLELLTDILENDDGRVFDYFEPQVGPEEMFYGSRALRAQIAGHLNRRDGCSLDPSGVIVTSGSTQGLSLVINAYLGPGDGAVVESGSYPHAVRYMELTGAQVERVGIDAQGLDADGVEQCFRDMRAAGIRPKLVYTISTFHVLPTGGADCLSIDRRRQLVDLAARWGVIVVEDYVYGELRYSGDPLPTLLSLDESGLVIQAGSFSKTVAPTFRLGWMAGAPELIGPLGRLRQDLGVSQLLARVMTRVLAEDHYEAHLARLGSILREKRDIAVEGLRTHCEPHVRFSVPDGSFFIWLEMAEDRDWDRVQSDTRAAGFVWRFGDVFTGNPRDKRFIRFAFGHASLDELAQGMKAFGEILEASPRQAFPSGSP